LPLVGQFFSLESGAMQVATEQDLNEAVSLINLNSHVQSGESSLTKIFFIVY